MVRNVAILLFRGSPVFIREFKQFLPDGYYVEYSEHTWQGARILITTPDRAYCITSDTHAIEFPALSEKLQELGQLRATSDTKRVQEVDVDEEWETAEEWETEEELEDDADAE